jgi:hypothetical protein
MTRRTDRNRALALKLRLARESTLPTVAPETVAGILRAEADKPMRGGNAELAHTSLWGDAWKQMELL